MFYANLTLASWIKFQNVSTAAIIMTMVFGLGFVYLIVMHVRWLEPVAGPAPRVRGPNLKVSVPPRVGMYLFSLHVVQLDFTLSANGPLLQVQGSETCSSSKEFLLQEIEKPMGLPFDWHLKPRRFGSLTASASMPRSP